MANPLKQEVKVKVMMGYLFHGKNKTQLEEEFGVTRQTIGKWAKAEKWDRIKAVDDDDRAYAYVEYVQKFLMIYEEMIDKLVVQIDMLSDDDVQMRDKKVYVDMISAIEDKISLLIGLGGDIVG